MVKAWCIWCESGNKPATLKNGEYYWIHLSCADKLMDISSDIKSIKEMLGGIHPRNKKDNDKLNVVYNFILDMEDFKMRWDNIMEVLKNKR